MAHITPRIAVVNHQTACIELLEDLLVDEGYQSQSYTNVADALSGLGSEPPDLIILDICRWQPMNGWDILERLRRDPQTAKIPLIACTADIPLLHQQAGRLEELWVLVQPKPFDIEEMAATIRHALGT